MVRGENMKRYEYLMEMAWMSVLFAIGLVLNLALGFKEPAAAAVFGCVVVVACRVRCLAKGRNGQ